MVEKVLDLFPGIDFQDMSLIGAQHILPSTLLMLNSFFRRGLNPERVHVIGKCYSTDINTYTEMRDLGINVCQSSTTFDHKQSFDDFYAGRMGVFVENSLKKSRDAKALMLLDDGGELLLKFESIRSEFSRQVACVEQTTSGYEKLKRHRVKVPVVNVARSSPKLELEAGIVAKTAIQSMAKRMLQGDVHAKRVLVVGNGSIGQAIANVLEGHFDVHCWDINSEKSQIKERQLTNQLHQFDLIIGCTGVNSLGADDLVNLKKGAILASLSSSDREFDILGWRQTIPNIISCHHDFVSKSGVRVLNCGFPINFNGVAKEVDIPEFELTRSLLVGGICQAINLSDSCGLISMSKEIEQVISEMFFHRYSRYQPAILETM